MRALLWIVRLVLFVLLLGFAAKNSDPVSLRFFFDALWQAPLVIIILVFFAAGAALGALSLLGTIFQLRRDLSRARRDLAAEKARQAALNHKSQPPAGEAVAQQ